jgi:soluble lytic murein transglycosylase-like protein
MRLNETRRWGFLTLVIGLLASGFYWMDQEAQLIKDQMTALRQENERLTKRNEQRIYINDLAVEFSMDPTIVTLVDRYSRKYMKESGPEWRLVRNPEFLSYIMLSLIYVESKGDTHAVGDRGRARGLTQIWVSTAQDYGEVTAEALHRPETNISFAFKHFHQLLKKYQGNVALTLYAWNRGSRKVDRFLEYGESPGNGYAKKVYEAALVNNQELLIGTP